ncbi:hypothetical protein DPX16_20057 [Anabarilius grahami]|uniref:Uncharacterized protein n=1 Tax=Anabarilius grahami TaxID=495550 RepID=A0A3N0XQT2_ANAGA|nr:hypothetical protein DPX16_20057 [Anabarilius grahami]
MHFDRESESAFCGRIAVPPCSHFSRCEPSSLLRFRAVKARVSNRDGDKEEKCRTAALNRGIELDGNADCQSSCLKNVLGPLKGVHQSHPSGLPLMTMLISASEGEPTLSGDDDSAATPFGGLSVTALTSCAPLLSETTILRRNLLGYLSSNFPRRHRVRRAVDGVEPDYSHPHLSPTGSSGRFKDVTKPPHAPSAQPRNQSPYRQTLFSPPSPPAARRGRASGTRSTGVVSILTSSKLHAHMCDPECDPICVFFTIKLLWKLNGSPCLSLSARCSLLPNPVRPLQRLPHEVQLGLVHICIHHQISSRVCGFRSVPFPMERVHFPGVIQIHCVGSVHLSA